MTRKNSKERPGDPGEHQDSPVAIVGIGASAGGLEAIQSFFQAMPADTGMAFVVVQHLSPDYKSLMVELLSRKTQMPVLRADDGLQVLANHVYLIPPKKNLSIFHGKLVLQDQIRIGINLPVDIFLRSLAEDQAERSVAVILSGTGSDGTRGSRSIKESGGLVMVQDEKSAKFDGMPKAVQSTGLADFVLPPEEMPAQLLACIRHPYIARKDRSAKGLSEETGITRLFSLIRARTKVDFTYYKPSTVMRRIERRIAISQTADLNEYVQYLENTPSEVSVLYRELLIGVTCFFRDPSIMSQVQELVLPDLLRSTPGREVRFWVAGCSTGEEAYTLAMMTREVMDTLGISRNVKIFATDIDKDAVAKAGAGIYPESIAADLSPALLTKYFYRNGDSYQVSRTLREMVVFAQHNLAKDPPFTRIDLISCRNLLIYFQGNLQQHVVSMFGYSLNPGGYLVLGSSETVGEAEDRFESVDRKARIYRCLGKGNAKHGQVLTTHSPTANILEDTAGSSMSRGGRGGTREQERVLTRLMDGLAATYVPLVVAVNEHLEVLHTVGDTTGILSVPSGRAVLDISKMVDRDLAIPLATGIQKVFRTGEELAYSGLRYRSGEQTKSLRMRLQLLPGRKVDYPVVMVLFESVSEPERPLETGALNYDLDEDARQRLQDLEQELQFSRENLQATIEELETSNEELQATNEELLASNEELQSTNEELQSTNEELYTVNTEYQTKIIELTESQNDVDNLLYSSRIGVIILDEDFCIRRFSPQAAQFFHLSPSDTGRPLAHLTHSLLQFNPIERALAVQSSGISTEELVRSREGHHLLVRVVPYRVGPGSFAGVVLTLIDVTPLEEATQRLDLAQQSELDIVRHLPLGLFVYQVDPHGSMRLQSGNAAAERLTGIRISESLGRSFRELWTGNDGAAIEKRFLAIYSGEIEGSLQTLHYTDNRINGVYGITVFRLPGDRLAVCFEELSQRILSEERLRESDLRYKVQLELLADAERISRMGSWTWDPEHDVVQWSDNLFRLFRRDPRGGVPSFAEHPSLYTAESMKRLGLAVEAALARKQPYELELVAIRSDGTHMRCLARGNVELGETGVVRRLYGSLQELDR